MAEPKILLFDIETAPNVSYTWGKWEQNVIAFKEEFSILCYAYKWLGEKRTFAVSRRGHNDDKTICKKLRDLLNSADVVVAHNGDQFDIKKLNARLTFHKLSPCKFLSTVDTKKVAKRYFSFNSNSLDDLGKFLGLGRKIKHEGFDLWLKCMRGNRAAWGRMLTYNRQDVVLLEKVYKRLRPWITNHPNLSKFKNCPMGCPNCGSSHIEKRGVRANASGLRRQMRCLSCMSWFLVTYKE